MSQIRQYVGALDAAYQQLGTGGHATPEQMQKAGEQAMSVVTLDLFEPPTDNN